MNLQPLRHVGSLLPGIFLLLGIFCPQDSTQAADRSKVDFVRDIQPIFKETCLKCHGLDTQKGKLRLDARTDAMKGGKDGPIILVGNAEKSPLYQRILSADKDERMPQEADPLPADKIKLLKDWINQGAIWPDSASDATKHWAYQKPVRPALPVVKNTKWPRNSLDRFILARLEQEKLSPQPEADRYTLIRRVSLDLTGLPPSVEEVNAYLADKSPDAYEKLVDRLLAKESYGEHWARLWLDMARYADSAGYADDSARTIWLYRDWVIRSFNENKPFDQFTIEQIAGDLLPNATDDQIVATAFHRNTMTNNEGGTTDEEWRNAAIIDRVGTTMSTWMGTSMGCAQCHNHKYDPLTNKEYFQIFAILNNTADADLNDESPVLTRLTPNQITQRSSLEADIANIEKTFQSSPAMIAGQEAWERETISKLPPWTVLDPETFVSTGNVALEKQPDLSVLLQRDAPSRATFTVSARSDLKTITAFRLEVLADPSLPSHGPGAAANGNFVLSEFSVKIGNLTKKFSTATADFEQEGQPVAAAMDGKGGDAGWGILPQSGTDHTATFILKTPIQQTTPLDMVFKLEQSSQFVQHVIGKFRLSATGADSIGSFSLPANIRAALALPVAQRNLKQRDGLTDYYLRNIAPEFSKKRTQVTALKKRLAEIKPVSVPILRELKGAGRRKTYIQIRGNYLNLAEEVHEGVPAIFPPLPPDLPPNRLALGKWLISPNNPLTARVLANRLWEQIFGIGIVRTTEEFGTRGELPSHPELLDWLATEILAQKWDIKQFLKMLVTSASYRQTSRVTPVLLEKDPENRLISRGPRFRVTAEVVRDQALAVSGLLSPKLFGPPVRPTRPSEGLTAAFGSSLDWKTSAGDDKYRRAIYTEWRRTSPYPSMTTFDAPTREVCTLRRNRTNTPLQALVLLNDPVYIACAQALARKMMATASVPVEENRGRSQSDASRTETIVKTGFRLCLARPPSKAEIKRIVQLHDDARAELTAAPKKAAELATNPLGPAPDGWEVVDLAAWTSVANVLLNLDELMMKR